MTLRVSVTRRAAQDVDVIFDWLAKRSPDGARRWYSTYLQAVKSLPEIALTGIPAPESDSLKIDLRQMIFKTRRGNRYRALYLIVTDTIHVAAVRGFGQDEVTINDIEIPD